MTKEKEVKTVAEQNPYMASFSDSELARMSKLKSLPGWDELNKLARLFYTEASGAALDSVAQDDATALREMRLLSYGRLGTSFILDAPNKAELEMENREKKKKGA